MELGEVNISLHFSCRSVKFQILRLLGYVKGGTKKTKAKNKQARAELGQAQLKMELEFSLIFCGFGLVD